MMSLAGMAVFHHGNEWTSISVAHSNELTDSIRISENVDGLKEL